MDGSVNISGANALEWKNHPDWPWVRVNSEGVVETCGRRGPDHFP